MKLNKKKIIIGILIAVLVCIITGSAIYVNDYYHTDNQAVSEYNDTINAAVKTIDSHRQTISIASQVTEGNTEQIKYSNNSITKETSKNMTVYIPENAVAGLIFYPGGKVEYTAYEPLMEELARCGILSIVVKMPCNLAVLDINAADGIKEKYTQVTDWYMAGHSLGGSMAAAYVSKHTDDYNGLILLGAYSTSDISTSSLKVLSIYGSEDKVMNRDKYDKYESNLPAGYSRYIIEGGCHAYYGMYGAQKGDGTPSISNIEQIQITAQHIYDYISCK